MNSASCFFLDAFGVLNVGSTAIQGAIDFLAQLDKQKIPYLVLSNAASIPKKEVCKRFHDMGIFIPSESIITSREVLFHILGHSNEHWGVMAQPQTIELPLMHTFNDDEKFFENERFLFLSSKSWDDAQQQKWLEKFSQKSFEIWVANPDLTSPQNDDLFTKEPGFYTLLAPTILEKAHFIGKPFPQVFEYATEIAKRRWNIEKKDIMMVGDTLHTDILGANSFGLKSALIENYGFFKGLDTSSFMQKSEIYPNVRLKNYL